LGASRAAKYWGKIGDGGKQILNLQMPLSDEQMLWEMENNLL